MSLGKLLKQIAPIAISAFAGPTIGASFGAGTTGNKISLNSGSTVSVNT